MGQVPKRRFGRTELNLPVISCGGTRYAYTLQKESGNLLLEGDVSVVDLPKEIRKNVVAIVKHALKLGINHFETAHGYGSSEVQLGQALGGAPDRHGRSHVQVFVQFVPVQDQAGEGG